MGSTGRSAVRTVLAAIFCAMAMPSTIAAQAEPGAAQQLASPRESPKVEAVLWTRRSDRYTLQVIFPLPPTATRIVPLKNAPPVDVWLLKADGTVIPVTREPPLANTLEVGFSVSLAAGETAVAAALRIDDQYFIEALQPLATGTRASLEATAAQPNTAVGYYTSMSDNLEDWLVELDLARNGIATYTLSRPRRGGSREVDTAWGQWKVEAGLLTVSLEGGHAGKTVTYKLDPCLSYVLNTTVQCGEGLDLVATPMPEPFSRPLWSSVKVAGTRASN